jgi:hypothetical protein
MSPRAQLAAYVDGVGLLGPGIPDWPGGVRVLTGEAPWVSAPTQLPVPQCLPSAERRRTSTIVRLALAVGLEATARAGANRATLAAVFSSSAGDGENCHEICQALVTPERHVSPTRFHNSVHNAAAGYWGIATQATAASNALCAHDASFGAGILEALTQASVERTAVLLVAYDAPYPEPLRRHRPLGEPFAVALALAPEAGAASLARVSAELSDSAADSMADAALETLRLSMPAARSLPLLEHLARRRPGSVRLDYLADRCLALEVSPCR